MKQLNPSIDKPLDNDFGSSPQHYYNMILHNLKIITICLLIILVIHCYFVGLTNSNSSYVNNVQLLLNSLFKLKITIVIKLFVQTKDY